MAADALGIPGDGEGTPADPPTPDRASVLVVDDRRSNLVAMEALLAPLGRRIVLAQSGEEALRILLQERFALILLDVQMPGMDGFETARLIRGRLRTRRIPIIFVTAISTATTHMFDGYAAGAVDYLLKPIDPVILRSKVTLFIELFEVNARLQRQAERQGMEETLALAQQAGLSGIWHVEVGTGRARWSPEYAELMGLPAEPDPQPQDWLATVDSHDRDRVIAGARAAIARGGTWEDRFRVNHPARGAALDERARARLPRRRGALRPLRRHHHRCDRPKARRGRAAAPARGRPAAGRRAHRRRGGAGDRPTG